MSETPKRALSIKQPWATLVVHGLKTIEIRSWPTSFRGRCYIHTGALADDRERGWSDLPKAFNVAAELRGGLIGTVEVYDCIRYTTAEAFRADVDLHRNDPDWFDRAGLYGFRLREPKIEPYRALPGWVRFFKVDS